MQYYMCGGPSRGFRANQRGNGLGGIHCRRNSHRVIPLNAFEGTSWQSGRGRKKTSDMLLDEDEEEEEEEEDNKDRRDRRKCKSKPVVIKMVSAA